MKFILSERRTVSNDTPLITWSKEINAWVCYDDSIIDQVLGSDKFEVPGYDLKKFEDRFSIKLPLTKEVMGQFPLSNEGPLHKELRKKMMGYIEKNSQLGIDIFITEFQQRLSKIDFTSNTFDLGNILIDSILKANLALANIKVDSNFDYSDFALMLDDFQSIKSRIQRESSINDFLDKIESDERAFKVALISVGINPLVSSILNSIIKILTNKNFEYLIKSKFLYATGIKSIERICISATCINGFEFKARARIKLMSNTYETSNLSELEINRKFFISGTNHACQGMAFSLHIWKHAVRLIELYFTNLQIASVEYRQDDGIFLYPKNLYVSYELVK
jgi:hypothetical protein